MKIRTGFVSNSSSSSFIFALKKKPESAEELKQELFGRQEIYPNCYVFDDDDPKGWPTQEIAASVYNSIKDDEPNDSEKLDPEFEYYTDEEIYEERRNLGNLSTKERQKYWNAQDKVRTQKAEKRKQEFLAANAGKAVFTIEIADGNGSMNSAMEHGDLFKRVPNIRISKH